MELLITIKTIQKEKLQIKISSDQIISELKDKIAEIDGFTRDKMSLIYSGKVLDESQKLEDLNYKPEHYMILIKRTVKSKIQQKQIDEMNTATNISSPPSLNLDDKRNTEELSSEQIQELKKILERDPTIQQILAHYPQLRVQLDNPKVLMELLRRMNHPYLAARRHQVSQSPQDIITNRSGSPQIVSLTQEEMTELTKIKEDVRNIMGGTIPLTEGQLNSVVYQAYTMMNKDFAATRDFVINQLLDQS